MFYSHEVLTSRKYGVATVWLVATLGASSNSKKINRKAIQDVDVPKACRTIVNPAAPMALRLQGNLLYGVSSVYLKKSTYVLSDAKSVYDSMHLVFKAVEGAALDPHAGKARPDQLILPDDPSFLPEFDMPPPELLAELELDPVFPLRRITGESQSLTPFAFQDAPSTPGPVAQLILPTSSPVGPGGFMVHGNGPSSIAGPVFGDNDMIDAPDFTFDENGELVDLTEANMNFGAPAELGETLMHKDAIMSANERQEHEFGQSEDLQMDIPMDIDLPMLGDDLPEAEAFPTGAGSPHNVSSEVVESSETVTAPLRRKKRSAKVLPTDTTMELRNKDLTDWNENYLANMKKASRQKNQQRLIQHAKTNAEFWMWGSGIGGIAARMQGFNGPTPFDRFIGDNLFEIFTGVRRKGHTDSKRDRDSGIDEATQQESRRVRQKTNEFDEELGRGHEVDDFHMHEGDEVELAREEHQALDNQQPFSDMPWNITASIRGSSAVPRSGRTGVPGSAPPSSLTGRDARMVSESPLHRLSAPGNLEDLQFLEDDAGDFPELGGDDYGFFGPGISSDTVEMMVVDQDVPVQEALDAEGSNFLVFLADAIHKKSERAQQGLGPLPYTAQAGDEGEITFEEVIPPTTNNRVVATQALMMILTLGTNGFIDVRQDEHFADITLNMTEKGKAARIETAPLLQQLEDRIGEVAAATEGTYHEEALAAGRDGSEDEVEGDEGSVYGD